MIRRLVLMIKGNSRMSSDETQIEFARRYKSGLFFFLIPFAIFAALITLPQVQGLSEEAVVFLAFCAFFVMFFYALVYYRCPRCGTTPTSSQPGTTGVLLFPKKCSKCKAPLLPDHRWAQD
jgi:DNA-directed RNA polymerase subunit RPC12/RpoP